MITKDIQDILNSIRKNKGLAPLDNIAETTRLRADAEFDSFDLAELTVHVEDKFGVDVFEDGIIETVGELCAKLENRK